MNQQILSLTRCRLSQQNISSAAVFVQQSWRAMSIAANHSASSRYYASHAIQPVLPFLLPYTHRSNSRRSLGPRKSTRFSSPNQPSTFSTSQPKHWAKAILNPRTDDEGKPMMINISPRAAKVWGTFYVLRVVQLRLMKVMRFFVAAIAQEEMVWRTMKWKTGLPVRSAELKPLAGRLVVGWVTNSESRLSRAFASRLREITDPSSGMSSTLNDGPYDHLRVTVSSGGCHGFQYMMSLDPASKIDPEDTIFEADGGDLSPDGQPLRGEAKVVMDSASLELLRGSTVDYTMELIGSQFKIVDNPRAISSCGCGTSFDVPE
ncbi:iron-binding protein erpA [Paracoccidioides lutzii Pb01]|uniref:Iron-binding protein erpA n=1 Tax=Paracoccidioides lutzii (strain ATCC MYA-826 / Pb01) TaxID=502779 RepID=C1GSC9_PARBA|nr:iron-binding protein erpA [Paracoccidioides lutzii Pb01]EEH38962.2 iron-binding protein erpA [Paracoccidioides lutzii Pb01]